MRRSASEVINDLESRIAQLENRSAHFEQKVEMVIVHEGQFAMYVTKKYALGVAYKESNQFVGLYYRVLPCNSTRERINPVLALADALLPNKDFADLTKKLSTASKLDILHNLGVSTNSFPNGTIFAKNFDLMVLPGKLNESNL
jgi:hypothetical protein